MRDILIPKDIESSVEQNEISFSTISVEQNKKSHACCIVSPKSVSFDEGEESTIILSSNIDFSSEEENSTEDVVVFVPIPEEECNCKHEDIQQPSISDIIDFESVTEADDVDPDIVIPEDVIFSDSKGCELEHIVHHIKTEHRDYYKGTSFRWVGTWVPNKLYYGDEYFVDFVKYDSALWVCIKSHFGTLAPDDTSEYWEKVVESTFQDDSEYSTWLEYE